MASGTARKIARCVYEAARDEGPCNPKDGGLRRLMSRKKKRSDESPFLDFPRHVADRLAQLFLTQKEIVTDPRREPAAPCRFDQQTPCRAIARRGDPALAACAFTTGVGDQSDSAASMWASRRSRRTVAASTAAMQSSSTV
jgi:hypothetical protein